MNGEMFSDVISMMGVRIPGINGRVTDAALLVGGGGRRFNQGGAKPGKLGEDLSGRPLWRHAADALEPIFPSLFMVAHDEEEGAFGASGRGSKLLVISDETGFEGPAAGIAASLAFCEDWCFVAAADMPFLHAGLISRMVAEVRMLPEDAVCAVPRWDKGLEPLHAFYRKGARDRVIRFMKDGRRSLTDLAANLRFTELDAAALAAKSGADLTEAFFNVNTKENLAEAREIAERLSNSLIHRR